MLNRAGIINVYQLLSELKKMGLRTDEKQHSADVLGRCWTVMHEDAPKVRGDQMQKDFCGRLE